MDRLNPAQRSYAMSRVRSKDTSPEMIVRRLTHSMGYRFRLHCKDLPGSPDLVFPSRRKIIFVHGCFWHRHDCVRGQQVPKSRTEFWLEKLESNRYRDKRNKKALLEMGWNVLTLWECEIKQLGPRLGATIRSFLDAERPFKR